MSDRDTTKDKTPTGNADRPLELSAGDGGFSFDLMPPLRQPEPISAKRRDQTPKMPNAASWSEPATPPEAPQEPGEASAGAVAPPDDAISLKDGLRLPDPVAPPPVADREPELTAVVTEPATADPLVGEAPADIEPAVAAPPVDEKPAGRRGYYVPPPPPPRRRDPSATRPALDYSLPSMVAHPMSSVRFDIDTLAPSPALHFDQPAGEVVDALDPVDTAAKSVAAEFLLPETLGVAESGTFPNYWIKPRPAPFDAITTDADEATVAFTPEPRDADVFEPEPAVVADEPLDETPLHSEVPLHDLQFDLEATIAAALDVDGYEAVPPQETAPLPPPSKEQEFEPVAPIDPETLSELPSEALPAEEADPAMPLEQALPTPEDIYIEAEDAPPAAPAVPPTAAGPEETSTAADVPAPATPLPRLRPGAAPLTDVWYGRSPTPRTKIDEAAIGDEPEPASPSPVDARTEEDLRAEMATSPRDPRAGKHKPREHAEMPRDPNAAATAYGDDRAWHQSQRQPRRRGLDLPLVLVGLVALAALGVSAWVYADTRRAVRSVSEDLTAIARAIETAQADETVTTSSSDAMQDLSNRLAIVEEAWRDQASRQAALPEVVPSEDATDAEADGSVALADCMPQSMRFLVTAGDSYPVCGTEASVDIASVGELEVRFQNGSAVAVGGSAILPDTDCRVAVLSANENGLAGYGEVRVSC